MHSDNTSIGGIYELAVTCTNGCGASVKKDTIIVGCGARIAENTWGKFMCHNLGADQSLDPFTPAAGIHGAKYKWGTGLVAVTQAEDQSISGSISTWSSRGGTPPNTIDDWDMTSNNPCPSGYRVPTLAEWDGVDHYQGHYVDGLTTVGTFSNNASNYTAGVKPGNALFMPVVGNRYYSHGGLNGRGYTTAYWSTSTWREENVDQAYALFFSGSSMELRTINKS